MTTSTTNRTSLEDHLPGVPETSAGARLRALCAEEWQWREEQLGSMSGRAGVDDFLPEVDREAQQARQGRWEEALSELAGIPRDELSESEQVDYDVYEEQLKVLVDSQRFRVYERPATADNAFWRNLAFDAYRLVLETEEDARAYLRKLRQIPRHFEQHMVNMRAGAQRGFGPPKVCMVGREEPVRAVAQAEEVTQLPFFRPYAQLPFAMPEQLRSRLQQEAQQVLLQDVVPAYQKLYDFLITAYLPNLPEQIAVVDQPEGSDYYAAQLREYTTTTRTPEEIFDIGMAEVEKISAEMQEIAAEVGFGGDLSGLFAFMRTDGRFYAATERQLVAEAAYTCKAFDGVIHQYFGRLPDQRFSIMKTPEEIAAFDTFGRGAPDRYILNTYNLPARPLYSVPALTLHESSPGHSFQLSLARELDLPDFRRQYISAFGEGWGLYVERLGDEMGMYETPYERMGMLSFQMWRAVRLVVDPGMHALGWSREQAQDFLRKHTAISEHEIVTEIDRYISWPGQACSYYLGMLTIQDLRGEAEEALGERFSIRDFHDTILSLGNVPLNVLEVEVRRWIRNTRDEEVTGGVAS